MAEEVVDSQKMKKIAAEAYEYENDPKWLDYWSNILIPPQMASQSDVINHYKHKFYQRYIDPDLVVEPMTTQSTTQSARSSPPSTNERRPSSNSGTTTRATGASTPSPTPLRWDRQTIQFSVNAWVFVVAVLSMFPLIPKTLSSRAYRLSFMGTLCSSLYSLYSLFSIRGNVNPQSNMSQILKILSCILTLYIFRLPPASSDWTTVERYRPKFATRLSNPLIADDGKIYICLEKNLLIFKNNGSISATIPLKYTCNVDILPVLGAARKLYLVADNRVLKVDTWKTKTPESACEVFLGPETGEKMDKIVGLTASICSTVVVINIYKRGLFAYKYDGKLKWSIAPSISRRGYRQGCVKNVTGCYFLASPVIDYCDATFYVRNNIGELYAMTITRPRFKWIQDFSSLDKIYTITVGNNGRVYVTVPAKAVILALDVATGTVLWQQNIGPLGSPDSAPVADANGWISIGSLDGYLYSISPFGVVNTYPRKNTNIFSGGNAFFHPKNKSLIKDDLDSVIQVNPVLDCSGYAVYIAQTKMDGKFTRGYSEHTTVSALKPIKTIFTLLVPATGSVHWSESYPGSLSSLFNESDLRHYVMDESVLLVFLSISSTGNPLTCFSSRQKIASSCSMTDIKKVRMYTGNEKEIKKFLLFETIILIVLSVLVRFCCVFWNKRKLQNKDLGKFLEKRASLRLQKKEYDRTIGELEKKTAEGSSTNEMLEELGDLVKEREDVKRKLSTTYSLGRDGKGPQSESLIPLSDKKSKNSSYRSGKKESITILHTISDTSSEDDSSYEEVEEIDEKGKAIMEEAENSSDDEEIVEEQELLEILDDEHDHDQSVGTNLRKRSLSLTKNVESNE